MPRPFKKSKGAEASLCYLGHIITENRNGLVDTRLTLATGTAEGDAAIEMLENKPVGEAPDAGCRPRLRHAGVRYRTARSERYSARGAEYDQQAERN